jgi:hypothetical protein
VSIKPSHEPVGFATGDVAEGHDAASDRDISAPQAELATDWLKVPPASGVECTRALRRAGLPVMSRSSEVVTLLGRSGRVVTVPLLDWLPPDWLVSILRAADVSPALFTQCLDELDR